MCIISLARIGEFVEWQLFFDCGTACLDDEMKLCEALNNS